MKKPTVITIDLESTLVPEIWIAFAKETNIKELEKTTRDIPDYDVLMKQRIKILDERNLTLVDIQKVIETITPFSGAKEFLDWVRSQYECIIISDTFYEFATPILKKLDNPTVFCHSLEIDDHNKIVDYKIRDAGEKINAVRALQNIGFNVVAIGDSYNDTEMLEGADYGILFNASDNVTSEFPHLPSFKEYVALRAHIEEKI